MNEVCSHFLNSALLICNVIRMIADESWKTILPTQAHFHERWKTSFSVFWLRNPLNGLVLEEWEKSNGILSLRYGHIFFTFLLVFKVSVCRIWTSLSMANFWNKIMYVQGLNWDDLAMKKIPAPFIPKIRHEMDVSNFSEEFTNQVPTESPCIAPNMGDKLFKVGFLSCFDFLRFFF